MSQPECVIKIVFHFHTHDAKENILSGKNIFRFFFSGWLGSGDGGGGGGGKNAFLPKIYKCLDFF